MFRKEPSVKMTTLFGQRIEPDFDLAKEQRRDRVSWAIYGGLALCLMYLFSGRPWATEVFQGMFATVFPYGISFYTNQKNNQLGRLWLWKAILASLPVHVLYLMGVFWSDKEFPELMSPSFFSTGLRIASSLARMAGQL